MLFQRFNDTVEFVPFKLPNGKLEVKVEVIRSTMLGDYSSIATTTMTEDDVKRLKEWLDTLI